MSLLTVLHLQITSQTVCLKRRSSKAYKNHESMQINCQTNLRLYNLRYIFSCLLTNIISNSLLTKWLIFSCLLTSAIPIETPAVYTSSFQFTCLQPLIS